MAIDLFMTNVTLLLKGDGQTNGSTSILDTSVPPRTPTNAGAPVISTSVKKYGSGSISFNGTSNVSFSHNAALDLDVSAFTIEAWVNATNYTGSPVIYAKNSATNGITRETALVLQSTTLVRFYHGIRGGAGVTMDFVVPTLPTGSFFHLAVTRDSSNVWRAFIDGVVSVTTFTDAANLSGPLPTYIGSSFGVSQPLTGYIDDFRITKGLARYTANFTAPTTDLPDEYPAPTIYPAMDSQFSNVALLLHGNGANGSTTVTDSSRTPKTLTANGSAQISTVQNKFGESSLVFGTTTANFVSGGANTSWALGGASFCVECWIYPTAFNANGGRIVSAGGGAVAFNATNGIHWLLQMGSADVNFSAWNGSAESKVTAAVFLNVWTHVAATYDGSNLRLYINGSIGGALAVTVAAPSTTPTLNLGAINGETAGAGPVYSGYIDDLRISKGVARYTANYTAPSLAFPDGESAAALAWIDPLESEAFSGAVAALAPSRMLMYAGLMNLGAANLTSSYPILASYGGNGVALSLPAASLLIEGADSTGDNAFSSALSSPLLVSYGGAEFRKSAPKCTLSAAGVSTLLLSFRGGSPTPVVSSTGTTTGAAKAELTTSVSRLIGYSGSVLSVTIGAATLNASGKAGATGSTALTLPLFELNAAASSAAFGQAFLRMPALEVVPSSKAFLTPPVFFLTAIGTAVVVVTYEAYALNLNHKSRGREEPVDELTRYTNYPFDRIVRYKNSYFGMNSTGLFLLEGTTDDATPIPWDVQTAFTDFDSPNQKTVEMAYFGGRFGPAATVSLLVSENNTKTYTYTTPRDTDAQNYRQAFGKGNKARYYALGANGSGEMVIDSVTLKIAEMARKV